MRREVQLMIPTLTRRQLFRAGAVAVSGFDLLPMARPLNAESTRKVTPRGSAAFCVFLFLGGGLSHVDSFDLKEGKWTPPDFDIRTVAPGVRLPAGLFPKLTKDFSRYAIVRSLEAWETEHGRATYYMHTAHPPSPARFAEVPTVGAVVAYELANKRRETDILPPFVSMNYGADQIRQGCLDTRFAPLNVDTGASLDFVVPAAERGRFARRLEALRALGSLSALPDAKANQMEILRGDSLTMMNSEDVPKILKMDDDDRKRYGGSDLGDSCILARNILAADRGARFIGIQYGGWDFHLNIYDKESKESLYTKSRVLDRAVSEFLTDLARTKTADGRTLLDKTLVVVSTEFGRTTGELTPGKGRDHHRFAFSGLLAGAGVKGGKAIGSTDEKGERVVDGGWAARRSIYPEDLAATVYSAMGIDWTKRITTTPSGRAFEYVEPQSGTSFLQPSEIAELWI